MRAATFGAKLKASRDAQGLSQAALDEAIGKTRGFTAQIETDRLKPPPKDVCDRYDGALGRVEGETWQAAAPERLQAFDPDLYTWHREQLEAVSALPPEIIAQQQQRIAELEAEVERLRTAMTVIYEVSEACRERR